MVCIYWTIFLEYFFRPGNIVTTDEQKLGRAMIVTFITEADVWDFVNGKASIEAASAVFDYLKDHPAMAQQVGALVKRRRDLVEAEISARPELKPSSLFHMPEPFTDRDPTFQ